MNKLKIPVGFEVIASNQNMFIESPDVRGAFSHYDKEGYPHLFSKNELEVSVYGATRKFDLIRLP